MGNRIRNGKVKGKGEGSREEGNLGKVGKEIR